MTRRFTLLAAGLLVLFVCSGGLAQPPARLPEQVVVDTWPNMWLGMNNWGTLGSGINQCPPGDDVMGCEMPPGSHVQYLDCAALWIGALIDDGDTRTPRVSTAADGWMNPGINEFWPSEDSQTIERSFLDTVNCAGEPIYDPNALSHHEFEMTFYDTLDEEPYVVPDYDGTPHRPLGLRITRTVYSTFVPPCSYTYWIRYRIVNIGNNFLRNVYVGHMITSGVGRWGRTNYPAADGSDDVAGYEPTHEVAYVVDNDARDYIGSEWVWTSPHIAGLMYLLPNGSPQHPSFNWWISAIDAQFDYGPSWEDHVQWPDTAWMRSCDAGRYFVLSNGEIDFDQVRVNDLDWIAANPQGQHTWRTPDFPLPDDLANGFDVRALYSVGPFGEDMGSYRLLLPSDSFDVWMAIVGGRNFHDSRFPQPPNGPINPDLFNWDDLFYHADIVRNGLCVPWLEAGEGRFVNVPARFTLDPLWPNPFNARANIRFHLDRVGEVTIRAYDVLGRSALEITRETFGVGTHTIAWNAAGMPSGLYFIEARNQHGGRAVQKAVLVK